MGWQFWLAAPLVVTLFAALLVWWQTRPRATPSVHARVRDHHRFLDELGRHSGPSAGIPSSVVVPSSAVVAASVARASDEPAP